MTRELYDTIGRGYRDLRRPAPRIQRAIVDALGHATDVLNVGAGAGSYEPTDRPVIAVESSRTMLRQRPAGAAPAIQASATDLPFGDGAFDASLAVLTLHHWPDWRRGLRELARVSRTRIVIVTWDPWDQAAAEFWLLRDYCPEVLTLDCQDFPTLEGIAGELGPLQVSAVPIPHDCTDGFLGAYWRRPHEYLKPAVRQAISTFSKATHAAGIDRLRADLETGEWQRRHGALLTQDSLDLGYRLIVADRSGRTSVAGRD